jgi:hypothetical protein
MTFGSKVQFSALAIIVAAILTSGCGSDSDSNSVTAPSGLDLTGAWAGTFGASTAVTDRSPATWAATQSGTSPTGAFGLTFEEGGVFTKISGTLAGAVSGTQVAWTLTFPAGTFTAVGAPACSISGTGTSSATTTSSIVVAMNLTFAQACVGTVTDNGQTSEIDTLTLTK